jgi:type I restriction enzyme M protein
MTHSADTAAGLVRRLWQYCNVLRDDGLSYPDYVEQLTYLLFLKMADEQPGDLVPAGNGWRSFADLDGPAMHEQYGRVLRELGQRGGTLSLIFQGASNKIRDPAKLRLLVVGLVGQTEWSGLSPDVKGDAYEGLLEKNARDTKSGAGQYFTPRPLVEAIVDCVDPQPGEVVSDPACGTGGFLLAAHNHILARNPQLTFEEQEHLRTRAIRGVELVQEVARLAAMNLFLHGVSGDNPEELPISCADSLRSPPDSQVDVVLTNPPFGIKGSVTYASVGNGLDEDALTVVRPDFRARTANKQLNFLQHIMSLLRRDGRAAVVVPDNVLFESGAAAAIRRRLLTEFHAHTLLRLPAGLFYAHGVLANVLFFDAKEAPAKSSLWVYDLRSSNNRFTLKTRPITAPDLEEFVTLFSTGRRLRKSDDPHPRWRSFPLEKLRASPDARLDLRWEVEDTDRPPPGLARVDELAMQIADDLQVALAHITSVSDTGR